MTTRRTAIVVVAALAVVTVAVLAGSMAWVCDDALISFRYVRNVVGGHGLVFNPGERVEGFSSLSFVVALVPLEAIGANLFDAANALGIVATAVEVSLVVWVLARRQVPTVAIAVVAALFVTDRITVVWATGGLETAPYGALVMAVLALQLERPSRVRTLAVLHALLVATRPEGVIFLPIWLVYLGANRRFIELRRALNIVVPLIGILVAARLVYYGELVANPYRAKVEGVPIFEFGLGYTLWFLRRIGCYGVTALAIVPLVALAVRAWRSAPRYHVVVLLAGSFVVVQIVAVVMMGGDYMTDFRLFTPIMAPFCLLVGAAIAIAWQRPPRIACAFAIAALAASHVYRQLAPVPIFDDAPPPAEHQRILTITRDRPRDLAAALARFAEPGDSVLADWAGYMSYGHELRTIDATGLVSKHVTRDFYLRPERDESGARDRLPGHARWPTIELMQREHFTFIFPKLDHRPPEVPEIDETSTRRRRDYPFLHVTVPLGDDRFLRFFTTLDERELTARATQKRIRVCFRPPLGALTCVDPAR